MTMEGQDPGFENWLDRALNGLGSPPAPSPLPVNAAYHAAFLSGGTSMSMTASLAAAITSKVAAGIAAGAIVAGGAGAVVATSTTGSTDPAVWGKTVTAAVATCKDKAAAENQHGIGQCVSAVAKEKGVAERAKHQAKPDEATKPDVKPSEHPTGKPSDAPGGKPSDVPGGKPSGVPSGRPSSVPVGAPSGVPGGQPSSVPKR